ncbi:hypothetical protein DMB37_39965 [Nocardia sp. CS682]|nr:hypothetical protein DMB37_39965 [Nocardia sp. CS682]
MRPSDRFEALLRLLAVVAVLVVVPVAGALGTEAYIDAAADIRIQNATKSSVSAVITAEPTESSAYRLEARAQWSENGRSGTAMVPVRRNAQIGDHVTVWLGPDGVPTTEPRRSDEAAMTGIGVGVVVLVSTWLCGWCLVRGTGWLLDRHRGARWDTEWRQLSRPIREDRQ